MTQQINTMIYHSKKTRGFIALITVIIMSVLLLGLVSASNTAGYFNRFNALDAEYKRVALELAQSCVNTALLSLAQDYTYAPGPNMQVVLGSDSCTIVSVADIGAGSPYSRTVLITASAHYQSAFSTLKVEATIANPAAAAPGSGSTPAVSITSWQETN